MLFTNESNFFIRFLLFMSVSMSFLMQEGLSPINLIIETEMHRATPGGTGSVKTIGNYAAVSMSTITASF